MFGLSTRNIMNIRNKPFYLPIKTSLLLENIRTIHTTNTLNVRANKKIKIVNKNPNFTDTKLYHTIKFTYKLLITGISLYVGFYVGLAIGIWIGMTTMEIIYTVKYY
jgi:hypothetical protein